MSSLVEELQRDAYNQTSDVSNLLRKAYVVARKLKVKELEKWINLELNGYTAGDTEIPEYRKLSGVIKAWNPYHGWIPVLMDNDSMDELLTNRKTNQPITELEDMLQKDGLIAMKFPSSLESQLSKFAGFQTEFRLFISKSQLKKIIETVVNIILNWSLQLEEDGIMGEGMSFSKQEKDTASDKGYTLNFINGSISNSQIQQNSNDSVQNMQSETLDMDKVVELLDLIKKNINQIELKDGEKDNINKSVACVESEIKKKNPKASIIKESFSSIRNILEGVTGSIIASGILYNLNLFQ